MNTSSLYIQCEKEQAQACAWVFQDCNTFEKYYFKHPSLGLNDVQIRVISTGVCKSDLMHARGKWGKKKYPIAVGHEIVGEIQKIGEKVEKFKIGDRVMVGPLRTSCKQCQYCIQGKTNACQSIDYEEFKLYGLKYWGGYSTHVYTSDQHVFKLPSNLDPRTIPPLMCAGITTFLPLKKNLKKNHNLAVLGCGGLGHMAVQWGKKLGAQVYCLTSDHNKDELLKKLGGSEILIWTQKEHVKYKNHFDVIINTLPFNPSPEEMKEFFTILKPFGKWLQVGVPEVEKSFQFPPGILAKKMLEIHGSFVGGQKDYQEMLDFVAESGIQCLSEIYQWEDFPKALEKLEKGKPFFRCVVEVDQESLKYNQTQLS